MYVLTNNVGKWGGKIGYYVCDQCGKALDGNELEYLDDSGFHNDSDEDLCDTCLEHRVILNPGGRIIAVGDPNQSIYGFRGAEG